MYSLCRLFEDEHLGGREKETEGNLLGDVGAEHAGDIFGDMAAEARDEIEGEILKCSSSGDKNPSRAGDVAT